MTDTLRDEIRQQLPFRSQEQEVYLNLVRTAGQLTEGMERVVKAAGITLPQYNVLRILRGAEPAGLCRNEVRDRMLTRMPDMTRLLDRMEKTGFVTRSRDGEDRRQVTTRITASGQQLLERLEPAVAAEHRRTLGHLDREQLGALVELLNTVRHHP